MLSFKTRRTSQPQGAVEIDRSNPLSQSLLRSYDFSNGGRDVAGLGVSRWNTGGLSESISRAGRGLRVTAKNTLSSSESVYPYISTGVTIILLAEKHAAISGASNFIFGETTTADAVNFNWGFYESVSTGNLSCFVKNAGGASVNTTGGTAWVAGDGPQVWAMTYGDGDSFLRLYLNGVQVGAVAQTGLIQKNVSCLVQSASWNTGAVIFPNFSLIKADVFARNIGAAQVKALSDNPWQLFKPVSRILWMPGAVSGGGGSIANLAAAAASQASATADLLKGVSLAGAALSVASATGALALSVPLAGTATGQATSTGQLSLTVNLAASSLAQSNAGATLSLAINLSAAAVAQATAVAAFSGAVALAAAAIATAQASAALSVGKPLAASAQSTASSGATLWLDVPLSAAAVAQASAGGALSLTVNLSAAALGQANSSASLPMAVSLTANGVAVATSGATLRVTAMQVESRMYPLAGIEQSYPLTASITYPLAGV